MRLSRRLPKSLIEAYMNDSTFHAVVTQHEIEETSYTAMLEQADGELVKKDKAIKADLFKHAPFTQTRSFSKRQGNSHPLLATYPRARKFYRVRCCDRRARNLL